MKRLLFLLLAFALCEGCRSTYYITLNNGEQVTARGKPSFDSSKGSFTYVDGNGQKQHISQVDVRQVQPANWKPSYESKSTQFLQN
jgi:hypothetical protein